MMENMNPAESRQATTRINHTDHSGTRIHSQPATKTRLMPIAVAANQQPCMRPLYLGGETRDTKEIPMGLRKSSAIVVRK